MTQLKSKNDPILDAQHVCATLGQQTPDDLHAELVKLGWHEDVASKAIEAGTGSYIDLRDGMLVAK